MRDLRSSLTGFSFLFSSATISRANEKRISYSYVASLITYVVDRWRKFEGQIVHGNGTYDDNAPSFTDDAYLEIEVRRSSIFWRDNRRFEGL